MVIVSVQNVKGGCGKSTTAIHLACALAYMGRKVAIADGDPQNSALRWLKRRPAQLVRIDAIDFTKRDIGELKALKKRKAYDYVKASDIVLVPVVGLPMDIEVSQDFLKRLTHFRKIEKGKKRVAVVLNKVRAGGKIAARIAEIAVTLEVDIAARIPDKAGLQNPIEQGMTCFDIQRASNLSLRQCFIELAEYVDSSVSEQS